MAEVVRSASIMAAGFTFVLMLLRLQLEKMKYIQCGCLDLLRC
jgi:hypothetical protein